MKIAVTYENGEVFQHFGHCEAFKIYEVENQQVQSAQVVSAAGSGPRGLGRFSEKSAGERLICGGIGGGPEPLWPMRESNSSPAYRETRMNLYRRGWQAGCNSTPTLCAAITITRAGIPAQSIGAARISTAAPAITEFFHFVPDPPAFPSGLRLSKTANPWPFDRGLAVFFCHVSGICYRSARSINSQTRELSARINASCFCGRRSFYIHVFSHSLQTSDLWGRRPRFSFLFAADSSLCL